jgi:hypothetical protein
LEVIVPENAAVTLQLPALVLQYEEDLPVQFPAGRELVETVVSGGRRSRRSHDERRAVYIALPIDRPGRYQLWFFDPPSPAMAFAVASEPANDPLLQSAPLHQMKGLVVRWTSGTSIVAVDALADGTGPHDVSMVRGAGPPTVAIDCPVPLVLRLSAATASSITREGKAGEIAAFLAEELPTAGLGGTLSIDLDAGAFGRCVFALTSAVVCEPMPHTVQAAVPGALLRRARWLLAVRQALPRRERCPMSVLPADVRNTLGLLAHYPDLDPLRRGAVVPTTLLPGYIALAAALRRYHTGATPY